MKTFLIVNPWIYDFAAYDLWMKPWGLLKIMSVLKSSGHGAVLVDAMDRHHRLIPGEVRDKPDGTGRFMSQEIPKPAALKGIPRKYKRYGLSRELFEAALPGCRVDAILVSSGMTYWYPGVFETIKILKKRYKAPVILGGAYATLCREHAVRESGADHVVSNGDFRGLEEAMGIECGFSFRSLLEADADISSYTFNPYAVLRVSLGCPFSCAYCAQKKLGPGFMLKSLDGAIKEVKAFYDRGIKNFAFYDDALLFDGDHIEEYFSAVVEEGIKGNFYTPNGLHARFLKEKTAFLIKKMNFVNPILSLETANCEVAETWHDKVDRDEFRTAVNNLRAAGYKKGQYTVYLMLGAPGSSTRDVKESMEFAHSLGARISLSEYSPISGTLMSERLGERPEDPLMENNSIFPFYSRSTRDTGADKLKSEAKILNASL
ncbi:MAG TPA: B12-binding domain-containing radical SAM protein [Candidatus Omnitrophota bacterium]|nr:B12-binding domain-containing radical SAM protein [Candidatus Omnitrophota bacterium]